MNAVLVTGGAGFIGCHFVRHCLARDRRPVIVLDKLTLIQWYLNHPQWMQCVLHNAQPGQRLGLARTPMFNDK